MVVRGARVRLVSFPGGTAMNRVAWSRDSRKLTRSAEKVMTAGEIKAVERQRETSAQVTCCLAYLFRIVFIDSNTVLLHENSH